LPTALFYGKIYYMADLRIKKRMSPSLQILLGFMGIILIGTFLLCLPISNNDGQWLGFVDSFFTSTSAVCVTGLVVVDTAVQFTLFGQIVILFLIQIGGLGIVALSSLILLLLSKKINLTSRIALKESLNRDTIQGVVKFIKKVIILTFKIEVLVRYVFYIVQLLILDLFGKVCSLQYFLLYRCFVMQDLMCWEQNIRNSQVLERSLTISCCYYLL